MSRLLALLTLLLLVGCSGAGDTSGPCNDSDPAGICANSHSHVGGV